MSTGESTSEPPRPQGASSGIPTGPEGGAMPSQVRLVMPGLPEAPPIYANFVQVGTSPHEFTLHFGWYALPISPPQPGVHDVPIRTLVSVAVPLNLVEGLIAALESASTGWQTNFDQPLPRDPTRPSNPDEGAS